ncbi:hypothetical protein CC1G_03219 [Coprinopsis cinerea okayama7|uniref:NAD(P)-binding protein n=1 Tax=Coprinopsis cinerea (strain Okayama-7 / 130 / ATCC MYA-4618 / FGSC 9003) TaxID=240176 RepID=A8N776_COPC7|nr:hypothetical protein CC1G_03219 [Coprinopsis cinerea okayama7\|eukprot:XP_001830682.1 hypothetical protein CC1G_03219 [Coprinopsis cinerea okayama7\
MTAIPDEQLFVYGERVKGKVVVITGASNGIGRETALRFAVHGAKVAIGDLDEAGGKRTVGEIEASGGSATFVRTNVTNWDDQVALFEHAISTYGAVDIVVPNAGVAESPPAGFATVQFDEGGRPVAPSMLTIDVNVKGACYTAHLAQHYLLLNSQKGDLKAIVLIGSMASWVKLPLADLYTASKHAMLGLMRGMYVRMEFQGIRIACVHPWFADTEILPTAVKLFLSGMPLSPIPRIANAIFYAATDPDPNTNGASWLLADDGPVVLCPKEDFKFGVYSMLDERVNAVTAGLKGIQYYRRLVSDLWRLSRPLHKYLYAAVFAGVAWSSREHLAIVIDAAQQRLRDPPAGLA